MNIFLIFFTSADSFPIAVPYVKPKDETSEDELEDAEFEALTWKPGVADTDLVMYLRAARSMAAFAGIALKNKLKRYFLIHAV